jgi:hypothetical protein
MKQKVSGLMKGSEVMQYVCKTCGWPVGYRLFPSSTLGAWKHLNVDEEGHRAVPRPTVTMTTEGEVK